MFMNGLKLKKNCFVISDKHHNNRAEKGRSMIEMVGVLAIVGVLSAGGLIGYSQAMKKIKINQTLQQMHMIISNVKSRFADQSKVREMTLEQAIQLGLFPEEMFKSASVLQNRYKGAVTFGTAMVDGKRVYRLSFDGLPEDVAAIIATSNWDNEAIVKVVLNGAED